jgi:Pentapeptide repeats (8 copies)
LRGKTAWDWLDLMIVPVMLALFAGVFTTVQLFWQTANEEARQQALADQTAQLRRIIEESQVQQTALQSYLDLMSDPLLNHDLRDAQPGSDVVAIAQAQTLTTLRQMDPQGKRTLALFLLDARLIQAPRGTEPVIDLAEADLSNADLSDANLEGADLGRADLSGADLAGAELSYTDLSGAEGVTEEQVSQAQTLQGATMPNGQKYEEWLKDKEGRGEGENSGPS